jgi:hypothetical protein
MDRPRPPFYHSLPFWMGLTGLIFLLWAWGAPSQSLVIHTKTTTWAVGSQAFGLCISWGPNPFPFGGNVSLSYFFHGGGVDRFFEPAIVKSPFVSGSPLTTLHLPFGLLVVAYLGAWLAVGIFVASRRRRLVEGIPAEG